MKIDFFQRNYKADYESRMDSQSNVVFAMHITGEKYALGLQLKKLFDWSQKGRSHWYLLTFKIGLHDYSFRFLPKGGQQ